MADIQGLSFNLTDTVTDTGSLLLDTAYKATSAVVNGVTFVYVSSFDDDGIQIFTLDGTGTLTPVGSVADAAGTALNGATDLQTVTVDGVQFLLA